MIKQIKSKLWLQPDWPAPIKVGAVCTTRFGGVSPPPWDSFNLALHVGDAPESVQENRQILHKFIRAQPIFLDQIHGTSIVTLDGLASTHSVENFRADASCTMQHGLACCVMVADCLPVLFCDQNGSVVAAAHAGWRGLLGQNEKGILDNTVNRIRQLLPHQNWHGSDSKIKQTAANSSATNSLMAWLGPCIGKQAFEVGEEVVAAFVRVDAGHAAFFTPQNNTKWMADLAGLARYRLTQLGVSQIYGNDSSSDWCTVFNDAQFFSYRRANAKAQATGRFSACIWLQP